MKSANYYRLAMMTAPTAVAYLIAGWLWFILSAIFCFEVPSSGAIMICTAVLAELKHQNLPWYRESTVHSSLLVRVFEPSELDGTVSGSVRYYDQIDLAKSNGKLPSPRIVSGPNDELARSVKALQNFADLETEPVFKDLGVWHLSSAAKKANSVVNAALTATVLFGSVLWAYGHLIW